MKIKLTKDPSHKGYYLDEEGNLYVFRFGGRPIKVDDYREDKPNENYNHKEVEVEKSEVVDGTKEAQKEYKVAGTEGAVHEYAEEQGLNYAQAETLLNINGDDYEDNFIANDVKDKALTADERRSRAQNELSKIREHDSEYNDDVKSNKDQEIFDSISKFYGYDKLTDDQIRETLDFAEQRGMYHSKDDIAAMRRVLDGRKSTYSEKVKDSDKAVDAYQKIAKEYDKIADKYYATDYHSPDYEKLREEKNTAYEKLNAAKKEAIKKFSDTIPYQELFKTGSEVAGVKTTFTNPVVDEKGYVKYQSEDIRSQCGPFGEVLRECRLQQFNSSITFDEKTNEPYYWGTMDLQYQHNDGGTNGMKVMQYTYSKKNGWEMTDTKGNIYHNGKKLMSASEIADYYVRHGYTPETALEIANKRIAERKD